MASWEPDINTDEMIVPPPPAELDSIENHPHQVLAAAAAQLSKPSGRVRAELGLLLAAVEATVLVDDSVLLSSFVDWQKSMLSSQGYPSDTVTQMGRVLSEALQGLAPTTSALLNI